ncbi:MAG TPA: hypothetical protein VFL93_03160 [Longimicrobiaceae bacterium]|nr:hypothetical protein [Longimicrobiaceae bacterium]
MRLTRLLAATALAAATSFVSAPLLCAQVADTTGTQTDTVRPATTPGDTTQNGMMPSGTMPGMTMPADTTQGGMMQNGANPNANPNPTGNQNNLTPPDTGTMPTGTVGGQTMPDNSGDNAGDTGAAGTTTSTPERNMGVHKEH